MTSETSATLWLTVFYGKVLWPARMYPDAGKLRNEVYPLPLGFIVIHLILSGCIASFAKRALGICIED